MALEDYKSHFVLVTGAAGFIASKIIELLCEDGYKVIGVDNFDNGYDVSIKKFRLKYLEKFDNFKFIEGNIENYEFLNLVFQIYTIGSVINLASKTGVRNSEFDPIGYYNTNVMGTLNILELMKKYDVRKMVLASSSSLYFGEKLPYTENSSVNTPLSQYASSKKASEVTAYTYHKLYNFDITVLRYFTVYGPFGRPDMSVFRFIHSILNDIEIVIYGDGNQKRDFTFVDDIANGTINALKANLKYEIINLAYGKKSYSILEIISLIEKILEKKARIIYKEKSKTDIYETQANVSKAKELLNWEAKFDPEVGLEKTINWHIKNNDFLKNIKLY